MYEKFVYFWLLWIIFIIVTFFMSKTPKRALLMIWILMIIICTPYYIKTTSLQLSIPFLLLIIGSIIFYVKETVSFYKLSITFTIMIGYVSILIWEKITPIWFFMPSYFIIPFITVAIVTMLIHDLLGQVTVSIVGITLGQVIFELILFSYQLNDFIGGEELFIHISIVILFLTIFHLIQNSLFRISQFLQRKFHY